MSNKAVVIKEERNHLNHFIAGEIAGMVGAIVAHPFDTIKTRLQIEMISSNVQQKNNTFNILKSILFKEGIRNIYKGILPPFLGYGLTSSLVFGVNGFTKHKMLKYSQSKKPSKQRLSLFQISICAGITGFFHTFLVTPIERVKIWSQSHKIYSIQSTKSLYSNQGIKGFFGGIKYAFGFQIVSYMAYFPIYELSLKLLTSTKTSKRMYKIGDIRSGSKKDIAHWKIFVSGGVAGVLSWIVGFPFDTMKTRVQSGFYTDEATIHALRRNYSVSFNGLMPAIYRAALLHSCVFYVYENVMQRMQPCHEDDDEYEDIVSVNL